MPISEDRYEDEGGSMIVDPRKTKKQKHCVTLQSREMNAIQRVKEREIKSTDNAAKEGEIQNKGRLRCEKAWAPKRK